jgi:hypothetical protein
MDQHVKIVAYLLIALGVLGLAAALCVLVAGVGVGGAAGAAANGNDERVAALFGGGMMMIVAAFIGLLSIPNIIAGWGLLKRKPWARVLAIVLACLSLLNMPIGTAIGAYSLWVLLNDETRRLFPG